MNTNPKTIGNISEAKVLAKLVSLGFICSQPFGDNAPYDLIVDHDNKLYKVQVKTIWIKDKNLTATFRKCRINTKETKISYYSKEQVDYFIAYCHTNDQIYVIKNIGQKTISLRIDSPKNNQVNKIKYAGDYLINVNSFCR